MIHYDESWSVIDSTKIKGYLTCPRRFFYEFLLGWKPRLPAHDLWYGIAVHAALEHIYRQWRDVGSRYSARDIVDAYNIFLEEYRKKFPASTDLEHKFKNPKATSTILLEYTEYYKHDRFDVVYTEISGSVPIGQTPDGIDKKVYFRLDTLCEDSRGKFILEHKTSGWDPGKWSASMRQSTQIGVGNHLLFCLYGDAAWGVLINGIFTTKPQKYEESEIGRFFLRVPARRDMKRLEDWRVTIEHHYDEIQRETDLLMSESPDQPVMHSFPKNEHGCMAYNHLCPYSDYCSAWTNPLTRCNRCPEDFIVEYWDPRSLDREQTTKVIL